jgi:peptidoglycan-N-acetylmuramic acid deacetylase
MTSVSREEMIKNLTDLEKIYEEKTGNSLSKSFRFPEGRFNKESIEVASELGYKTVFWSLAYADWDNERQPDAEKSIKLLLDNTHNGAIVLLHPTSKTNALILPKLIQSWRKMGYRFGTLDELVSKVK